MKVKSAPTISATTCTSFGSLAGKRQSVTGGGAGWGALYLHEGLEVARQRAELDELVDHRQRARAVGGLGLGFGRIVASETEIPNMLAIPV